MRGLHTKIIPSYQFWWKQNVERACLAVPKFNGERYLLAAALLSREEVASRNQLQAPKAIGGTSETGTSSSAPPTAHGPMPTAEWLEYEDLTSLDIDQLKGLKSMIEKWVARRDKVQKIVKILAPKDNI
ncbi:unnamed protein product [Linum trigynum]|uniref:Uncharacterized protein n=1 Tax=Linum trigynum TaxID=586398 RepID=A0AAV2EA37_9ROSI